MNTRKRPRFSYAEASSDDDEASGTSRNRTFTSTVNKDDAAFRGRSVHSRPKREKRSKRPSFDYAKIFDLPADILMMILAQLQAPTLWAISTASKPLQTFLQATECKGLWNKALSNWKVYAPHNFIHEIPHNQRHQRHFCGPFQHYAFIESYHGLNPHLIDILETMSEGDRVNYEAISKAPLLPPPCPEDIPEFQYAKFLFSARCDICVRPLIRDRYYTIAEFCTRRCIDCGHSRFDSLGTLQTEKQKSATAEKAKDLVEFTEFLCYEPYALLHHNGNAPMLTQRLLIFDEKEASVDLAKRLALFRSRKEELSTPDYKAWCESREVESEKRRQRGRHLLEFVYIRGLYDKYILKRERAAAELEKSRQQNLYVSLRIAPAALLKRGSRIFQALMKKGGTSYRDLELANRWSISFRNLLRNKQVLSEESGPAIQDLLLKYAKEVKNNIQENPHWAQEETGWILSDLYNRYISGSKAIVPKLSEADLWTLVPCRSFAKKIDMYIEREERIMELQDIFIRNGVRISDAAKMRATIIREQLFDLLLERKTDPDHEKDNDSNADNWVIEKLNHPASYFRCEKCKEFYDWETIVQHGCATLDMEHDSYTSFLDNRAKTFCKPVGFQISRVSAPDKFIPLYDILTEAAEAVAASSDWRYKDFAIPKTHSEAKTKQSKSWHFSCLPGTCEDANCPSSTPGDARNQAGRMSFHEMMLHLFGKIEKKSLKLKDLAASSIRVYAGPTEK